MIYNNTQGISSANDLIQIMNIGNQFYSSLSQLTRQAFLMQSELPTALNVFDNDYQLEYSENYSGTVYQETSIDISISIGISVLYLFMKRISVTHI